MSFLISKSVRTLSTINRASRLHIAQRIQCRLFTDKTDDVNPSATEDNTSVDKEKLGGFAKAFEKFSQPQKEVRVEPVVENVPFSRLLRKSKFVDVSSVEYFAP